MNENLWQLYSCSCCITSGFFSANHEKLLKQHRSIYFCPEFKLMLVTTHYCSMVFKMVNKLNEINSHNLHLGQTLNSICSSLVPLRVQSRVRSLLELRLTAINPCIRKETGYVSHCNTSSNSDLNETFVGDSSLFVRFTFSKCKILLVCYKPLLQT